MRVYLLRHGTADPRGPFGEDSADRRLVAKGRAQAEKAGSLLARIGARFGRVLSSPYLRAKETAEIALAQLDHGPQLEILRCLEPMGSSADAIAAICQGEEDVLAVGHEPLLSQIGAELAGDGSLGLDLRKGGIIELEILSRDPAAALLLGLLRPRHLR